jgi:transposase
MGKKISAETKSRVAIEALRGEKTANEIAGQFHVHPNMIAKWKAELLKGSTIVFSKEKSSSEEEKDRQIDELYRQLGKLQMQNNFLKKKCAEWNL